MQVSADRLGHEVADAPPLAHFRADAAGRDADGVDGHGVPAELLDGVGRKDGGQRTDVLQGMTRAGDDDEPTELGEPLDVLPGGEFTDRVGAYQEAQFVPGSQ